MTPSVPCICHVGWWHLRGDASYGASRTLCHGNAASAAAASATSGYGRSPEPEF